MTALRILSRDEWGATAALYHPMRLPADEVWIHHSVTAPDDDGVVDATDDVAADMRELERIGVARFGRFSYSYAVHPSGVVAQGAGLTIGAHTKDRNSHSIGIVFVGNYDVDEPPDVMLTAAAALIRHLVAIGALRPGVYPTGGHVDAPDAATACPGRHLEAQLDEIRRRVTDPPEEVTMGSRPYYAVGAIDTPEHDGGWVAFEDGFVWHIGNAAELDNLKGKPYFAADDVATGIRPAPTGQYGYTLLTRASPDVGYTYTGAPRPPLGTADAARVARLEDALRSIERTAGEALA